MCENMHMNATPSLFHCRIGPDGIIYLMLAGKIAGEDAERFIAWTEEVKDAIKSVHEKHPNRVLILSDVTALTHFEKKPIEALRTLLEYDKEYTTKSAIVGASPMVRMLVDAVVALSGRSNVKLFDTRDEALEWLNASNVPDEIRAAK